MVSLRTIVVNFKNRQNSRSLESSLCPFSITILVLSYRFCCGLINFRPFWSSDARRLRANNRLSLLRLDSCPLFCANHRTSILHAPPTTELVVLRRMSTYVKDKRYMRSVSHPELKLVRRLVDIQALIDHALLI